MEIGRLSRRIEIQQATVTLDNVGGEVRTWSTVVRCWAQSRSITARERFASEQIREAREEVFIIRYRKDITPEMRIVFQEKKYRIVGLAEIGQKSALEITAEYIQAAEVE